MLGNWSWADTGPDIFEDVAGVGGRIGSSDISMVLVVNNKDGGITHIRALQTVKQVYLEGKSRDLRL